MTQLDLDDFDRIIDSIPNVSVKFHSQRLIEHARQNYSHEGKSIKALKALERQKTKSGIVISAGPSVNAKKSIQKIRDAQYKGTKICIDGSYVACLREGLIPDYVLTLDPHPKRIASWFGDHNFEKSFAQDDYFKRQDLDVDFRSICIQKNKEHIELVNQHGYKTKAIVSSSSPANVVARLKEAGFDLYWWNPLVDDPNKPDSITRKLYNINKLPCMNTGGTVGTAAWVFASSILKLPIIGVVGMDLSYYMDTPIEKTQLYYELIVKLGDKEKVQNCVREFVFPLTNEKFYCDPTYFWYRKNFLELLKKSEGRTFNCTEAGTLFSEELECIYLDDFLKRTI